MNVLLVADGHYLKDPKGQIYSESIYDYDFYKRYLMTFDHVYAVVRIENIDYIPSGKKVVCGKGITFLEFPRYQGPWQYAKVYLKLIRLTKKYCNMAECGIFRLPGATANIVSKYFLKTKKPFSVEIVVDPWKSFAPGSIKSITRPFIRILWTKLVKDMCKNANGVSYVTAHYLQEKYPCPAINNSDQIHFTGHYSSVELPDDTFGKPRQYIKKDMWCISHVANSYSDYVKGHITLMEAVKIVRLKGYKVSVMFIGDGPKKEEFKKYATKLGIIDAVNFLGRLPNGTEVRKAIRNTDIFVFPTKAEGLPRCLLEAMAEGLPCISSPVCGIPEVISEKFLCEYDDYEAYAKKIIEFIENPFLMEKASYDNLKVAKEFASHILNESRKSFYDSLRKATEDKFFYGHRYNECN